MRTEQEFSEKAEVQAAEAEQGAAQASGAAAVAVTDAGTWAVGS